MNEPSALASVRALRNQILANLERNEDFRVLRGLEFVLAKETRLRSGTGFADTDQAQARSVQDGLAAPVATPVDSDPNGPAAPAWQEQSLSESKPFNLDDDMPLVFPQLRTGS